MHIHLRILCMLNEAFAVVKLIVDFFSSLHTVDPGYSLDGFVIEPHSFRTELEEAQNRHDYESEVLSKLLPTKQQILNCLAVHGHWITTQPELQVCIPYHHSARVTSMYTV